MEQVTSIIAGSVWKIQVAVGDQISSGQEVIILESMKMEIPIESEVSGTVVNITIAEGDFVNEGDVLLEVE